MTNTYNTGNPLGSTDPRDLYDNASNFDEGMNSSSPAFTDRLGQLRKTWNGMETEFGLAQAGRVAEFQAFLVASGYVSLGNYAAGINFTAYNQYLARDGFFYRPAPSTIPFTTTGTWAGGDEDLFVLMSEDAVLRQDLNNPAQGAKIVAWARSAIAQAVTNAAEALDAAEFSLWEFADAVTVKPNPADPKTWDWAPAVQAAVNAPSAYAQHTIKVHRGVRLASTVTVNNGVKFVGAAPFDYSFANFVVDDPALVAFRIRAHYVVFDNIFIEGPGKVGTGTAIEVGDGTTNWDKFAFTNDSFVMSFNVGIDIKTQNWRVDTGSGASTCAVGFKLTGLPSTANNRNGYFINANIHSCDVGIELTAQWQALGVIGCDFNSTALGITGTMIRSVIADNVFFNGLGTDIQITGGQNVSISGNAFNGTTNASNTGHGISIAGTHHSITGNVITNKGGNGILAACGTSAISGNTVLDADYYDATAYAGIKVTGNGNTVVGNISRTSTGGASRQTYGIELTGTSNLVSANYVQGNKTAGVLPGTGNKVFGNTGYVTENKGTASIGTAATSVTVTHGLSYTPTVADVSVTPTTGLGSASTFWVNNFTATTFQINLNVAPGSLTVFFGWQARA